MKNQYPSILIVTLLLAGLLLGACSNAPIAGSTQPARITVVDALERTTEFDEPPQRIVLAGRATLPVVNTLYLFSEAPDRVVGVTSGNQKPGDFLALVDPGFDGKTMLAPDAGPEQITPLKPDIVIMRSFLADSLGNSLEQVGIPVVYVDLETPEQYARDLETLGQLLGNGARAKEIQAFYQARLDSVAQALSGLEGSGGPRVLIVQYSDKGGEVAFSVPSAAWLQTTQAELVGADPVWTEAAQGGGWTVVNLEQIAAWDPDQVFVIDYKSDSAETVAALLDNPQWQALRAAKEGQVYGFAGDIYSWDQPDPRWILGVTWLAGKVHPEEFSDLDTMASVSAFFGQMYGLDETAIQEEIVPRLRGDVE